MNTSNQDKPTNSKKEKWNRVKSFFRWAKSQKGMYAAIIIFIVEIALCFFYNLFDSEDDFSRAMLALGIIAIPVLTFLVMEGYITQGPWGLVFRKTLNMDLEAFLINTGFTKVYRRELNKTVYGSKYHIIRLTKVQSNKELISEKSRIINELTPTRFTWTILVDDNNKALAAVKSDWFYLWFTNVVNDKIIELYDNIVNKKHDKLRLIAPLIIDFADPIRPLSNIMLFLNRHNISGLVMVSDNYDFQGFITTEQLFTLLFIHIYSSKYIGQ